MKGIRPIPKGILPKLALLLASCLFSLALLEVLVRIIEPVDLRIRGSQIELARNRRIVIDNKTIPGVDRTIVHTKNSIGFRGPDPPLLFDGALTVLAVGGSTTESYYVTDGKTWPDALGELLSRHFDGIWLNNAGLDGHSTFGHAVLMRDYVLPLRPDVVLFMVGINDVGIEQPNELDDTFDFFERYYGFGDAAPEQGFVAWLTRTSDVAALVGTIARSVRAHSLDLGHRPPRWKSLVPTTVTETEAADILRRHAAAGHVEGYRRRVGALISMARSHGIEPVLITQATVGRGTVDDLTGIDLRTVPFGLYRNAGTFWRVLERYNATLRDIARHHGVHLIEFGRDMPTGTRYFYDTMHLNNDGCMKAADVIFGGLCEFLAEFAPQSQNTDCP